MITKLLAAGVLASTALGLAACSNNSAHTAIQPQLPTAPLGSTLTVTGEPGSQQSFTVSKLFPAGTANQQVEVTLKELQGNSYVGYFSALTAAGTRVDQIDDSGETGTLDEAVPEMIQGEVRQGAVTFPTNQPITALYYYYSTDPKAEWTK